MCQVFQRMGRRISFATKRSDIDRASLNSTEPGQSWGPKPKSAQFRLKGWASILESTWPY